METALTMIVITVLIIVGIMLWIRNNGWYRDANGERVKLDKGIALWIEPGSFLLLGTRNPLCDHVAEAVNEFELSLIKDSSSQILIIFCCDKESGEVVDNSIWQNGIKKRFVEVVINYHLKSENIRMIKEAIDALMCRIDVRFCMLDPNPDLSDPSNQFTGDIQQQYYNYLERNGFGRIQIEAFTPQGVDGKYLFN